MTSNNSGSVSIGLISVETVYLFSGRILTDVGAEENLEEWTDKVVYTLYISRGGVSDSPDVEDSF